MNIVDTHQNSHLTLEPLPSIFDSNNNIDINMNNNINDSTTMSMNLNMNNGPNKNVGEAMNSQVNAKLMMKNSRGRNTRDLKELVSNFWMPQNDILQPQPLQGLKNNMQNNGIKRKPSADAFGNFHPIELKNNNGKPNAPMDMRIPLENPSSGAPIFSANNLGINKNAFLQPNNFNRGSSSNGMNSMMPPLTQSMSKINNSRRVSLCQASVISDDSTHSRHSVKASPSAMINAATNILNGSEFEGIYNMNHMNNMAMGNNILDPIHSMSNHMGLPLDQNNSNVVSEPGPYDIVCGRNSGAYNYIGNRRFRVTIEMNLQRYIDSPTREDKTNVIKSIVWMLHEQVGARFLKKETTKKSSGSGSRRRGTPRYTIMTDKQAREKVGHALRDLVITARKEQQLLEKKQAQAAQEQGPKEVLQQC